MSQLFDIKFNDMRRLRKWYRRAPKQFTRAAAGVLNDFVFGVRKESIQVLNRKMIVRNSRFVESSLRVQKARGSNLKSLSAETGSIKRPRFSGWAEQELGTQSKRTKTTTKLGRGGDLKGTLKPRFRMKPGARFPKPSEFDGATSSRKVNTMLRTMRRKTSKPFIITGSNRFRSGLYKFQNRKVRALQVFKRRKQPKRIPWHTQAKNNYFRSINVRNIWAQNIRRTLQSSLPR